MKKYWPRASVTRNEEGVWNVWLRFGGNWNQEDVWIGDYDRQEWAIWEANDLVRRERRRATYNPSYRYPPKTPEHTLRKVLRPRKRDGGGQ
jgi:hypothetical protein